MTVNHFWVDLNLSRNAPIDRQMKSINQPTHEPTHSCKLTS